MLIRPFRGTEPRLHSTVLGAETAAVIGDVTLGPEVSLWYGAVLRGDVARISVGKGSNIQDNAVLHCDRNKPCVIGDHVTVGHNAVVHSAVVGEGTIVGMGATLLSGCVIGPGCIIGGGAVVPGNLIAPEGSLILGVPAKVVRKLTAAELMKCLESAEHYKELAKESFGNEA